MRLLLAITSITSITVLTAAQGLVPGLDPIDPSAKAAYFTFVDPATKNDYVFALNAVDNGDIYFHMSTKQRHSWIGVGIGDQMAGAFMLISYAAENGTGLITSPRIATGHNEPVHTSEIEVVGVYSDAYAPNANTITKDGAMVTHAMCRNCTRWISDYLNTSDPAQPFIFALGPDKNLRSESLDAGLGRHQFYGHFNLDMTAAFSDDGYGRVPAPNVADQLAVITDASFASFASSEPYDTSEDVDRAPIVHAVMMCIAFIGVFPLGALLLRLMKSMVYHAVAQGVGLVMVIVGFGIAVSISKEYNRTKDFNSAHQVIGILLFAALFVQLGLGLAHHHIYRKSQKPTALSKVHLVLGPAIVIIGLINGGLGISLANSSVTAYVVVLIVLAAAFAGTRLWLYRTNGIKQYKPERTWTGSSMTGVGADGYKDDAESPSSYQMEPSPQTPYGGGFPYSAGSPYGNEPQSAVSASFPFTPVSARRAPTFSSLRDEVPNSPMSYRSLKEDWSLYKQGKL